MSRLERLQRWMQEVITHPEGVEAGLAAPAARDACPAGAGGLEALVLPSARLDGLERIRIYSRMYFLRLRDCLAEDFPGVLRLAGAERFDELARAYLAAHPSRHYSLNRLGASFPGWLRAQAALAEPPPRSFVAEVAEVELAVAEVFDAPEVPPAPLDALLAVPPEAWGRARLRLVPAHRLLDLQWPVHPWYRALHEDGAAPPPERPERSPLLVYRRAYTVWRAPLDAPRHALLAALASGAPLAEALERAAAAPGADPAQVAGAVDAWFRGWAADGLFAGVEAG